MVYEFLFFFRGSSQPACERRICPEDAAARVRAAEELLRMPSRVGVEVWCAGRLVYNRSRTRCDHQSAA